jgi:hypothetical protein
MASNVLLFLLVWPVLVYVTFVLNMVGHSVTDRLAGLTAITSLGLGMGRPVWSGGVFGVRVFLCRQSPLQPLILGSPRRLAPGRGAQTFRAAGGLLAHALAAGAAAALLVVTWPTAAVVWGPFGGLNALALLINLLPFTVRVGPAQFRTDASVIFQVLRDGSGPVFGARIVNVLRNVRPLCEGVGDLHCLHDCLVLAADSWAEWLGDAGHAEELLAEARGLPVRPTPALGILRDLVAGEARMRVRDFAGADRLLGKAEELSRRAGEAGGLLLVRLCRVESLQERGETAAALRLCDELDADPLIVRNRFLRDGLLVRRLLCQCALPDGNPEGLLPGYEAVPARRRLPGRDLMVYQALARHRRRHGDAGGAAEAYGKALAAVRSLDEILFGDDRERFRRARAGLVREARDCLVEAGREEEASRLEHFFPSPQEQEEKQAKARWQKEQALRFSQRRYLRWGLGLTLFNVCVVAWLIALSAWRQADELPPVRELVNPWEARHFVADEFGAWASVLTILLCLSTALTLVFGLILAAVGWLSGGLRRGWGVILLPAAFPWLLWATAVVIRGAGRLFGGAE